MFISISRRAEVRAKSHEIDIRDALPVGLISDDSCAKHLHFGLDAYGFEDGRIRLFFDTERNEWRVGTEYLTGQTVEPAEVDKLVERTLAQWADGIGEGILDQAAEDAGVEVDLFPLDADDTLVVGVDSARKPKEQSKPSLDLYMAAEGGKLEEVISLMDAMADVEFGDDGHTPLHSAILGGHLDVALELLKRGADPLAVYEGFGGGEPVDALMEAALSNCMIDEDCAAIAEALLARGVDPNGERDGYTPLLMAEIRDKTQMMDVLRKHGASA